MSVFTPAQLLALTLFVFVNSVTPGPNNAMLMASGAKFGLRRTAPHMAGVVLGFGVLIACVGLGLGALFSLVPAFHVILRWVGAAYLVWLAWKIATSTSVGGAGAERPMKFLEIVAFQWVNPKAWIGAVAILAAYGPQQHYLMGLAVIVAVCALVNGPVVLLWAGAGAGMRQFLADPLRLRIFNVLLAILLLLALLPMLF
jgi:threonine/homoserine/homoserine lactone efflux protein